MRLMAQHPSGRRTDCLERNVCILNITALLQHRGTDLSFPHVDGRTVAAIPRNPPPKAAASPTSSTDPFKIPHASSPISLPCRRTSRGFMIMVREMHHPHTSVTTSGRHPRPRKDKTRMRSRSGYRLSAKCSRYLSRAYVPPSTPYQPLHP
jgi:hypothetical protein